MVASASAWTRKQWLILFGALCPLFQGFGWFSAKLIQKESPTMGVHATKLIFSGRPFPRWGNIILESDFHSTRKGDLMGPMSHMKKHRPRRCDDFTGILRYSTSAFSRVVTRRLGPGRKVIWVILQEGGGVWPKAEKKLHETLMVQKFGKLTTWDV